MHFDLEKSKLKQLPSADFRFEHFICNGKSSIKKIGSSVQFAKELDLSTVFGPTGREAIGTRLVRCALFQNIVVVAGGICTTRLLEECRELLPSY